MEIGLAKSLARLLRTLHKLGFIECDDVHKTIDEIQVLVFKHELGMLESELEDSLPPWRDLVDAAALDQVQ